MKIPFYLARSVAAVVGLLLLGSVPVRGQTGAGYQVFVSNESSGDLTVVDGATFTVAATIPVGKRPRGIHHSPDGKTVYVALSGTPNEGPPKLDAKGNPIHDDDDDDDDDKPKGDKAADGIGVVDVGQRKFLRKLPAGSDPEEFALSLDGKQLYVANEDVSAATVLDAVSGRTLSLVRVGREPEGMGVRPDGKAFYVTCETAGEVFAIDTRTFRVLAQFKVNPRPRSIAFLPDSSRAFVPSENTAELNVIDLANHTVLKVIKLPAGSRPMTVLVSLDGKKVYTSNGRGRTISVVDANTYEVVSTIRVGGARPWGMEMSPDGKYLFTANGPSDDISVVDLATEKEIARVKSPGSPWGVTVVPTAR